MATKRREANIDKLEKIAKEATTFKVGDVIEEKGLVLSIRDKSSRYGRGDVYYSIVVKTFTKNDQKVWFSRTVRQQEEHPVKVGDLLEFKAKVRGESADGQMTFLEGVEILNTTCTHTTLRKMRGQEYKCEGCGTPLKVS